MASESFDVTDSNGINVTGTVEVFRDPKGAFFDPKSEYYGNPRYADALFEYFNTRGACTIDRDTLSNAMQEAFANALKKFGIAGPDSGSVQKHVDESIAATRQQCVRNADKYVSKETNSSADWGTGKSVGDVTAKAYAAEPAPGGGSRTVVARENSWPAADISALANHASAGVRILNKRKTSDDWSSPAAYDPGNVLPPSTSEPQTPQAAAPVRYLDRRNSNESPPLAFDTRVPAVPFVVSGEGMPPDREAVLGNRFSHWSSPSGGNVARNPNITVPPPESSGPMLEWNGPRSMPNFSDRSAMFDTGELRRGPSQSGTVANGPSFPAPPTQESQGPASSLLEYIRHLNERDGQARPASMILRGGTEAPLAPNNDYTGGPVLPGQPVSFDDRFEGRTRPLGLVSGKPMPDYPFPPPIWNFPNDSASRSGDSEDWLAGLLRTIDASKRI